MRCKDGHGNEAARAYCKNFRVLKKTMKNLNASQDSQCCGRDSNWVQPNISPIYYHSVNLFGSNFHAKLVPNHHCKTDAQVIRPWLDMKLSDDTLTDFTSWEITTVFS
jgi:hypothetical protein